MLGFQPEKHQKAFGARAPLDSLQSLGELERPDLVTTMGLLRENEGRGNGESRKGKEADGRKEKKQRREKEKGWEEAGLTPPPQKKRSLPLNAT